MTRSLVFRAIGAVLALALVLGVVPTGSAQTAEPRGGPREGVKVIGDWTIVVRDEAGNEIQRSEFRNALQGGGKQILAAVLGGNRVIGDWAVVLVNGSAQYFGGQQGCGDPASGACGLAQRFPTAGFLLPFGGEFDYVTGLTAEQDPTDFSKMILRGSRKATRATAITSVSTWLSVCPASSSSASACDPNRQWLEFSGTQNFANPPQVQPNQTMDVTVAFSFQ